MYKSNDMRLCQFRFKLPENLIAQFPASYRDDARLMILHRKTGQIEHKLMPELVNYFDEGDLFVFNDSKVFPARLWGRKEKTNALIEVFLLRELNHKTRYWDVLVEPARKIRIGNKLTFEEDSAIVTEVIDNTTSRGRTFRFLTDYENEEFVPRLYALGSAPLPKYIRRPMDEETFKQYAEAFHDQPVKEMDAERYQTIFAKNIGAVAAPASGMHFSKHLLKRMEIQGIETTFMTSHVSLGIFKEIDVEDLTKNKMESEQIILPEEMANAVNKAHEHQHRVCAVGTEVMRAMEHVVGTNGLLKAYDGWTNKFIFPPYNFTAANSFFVNFYMPESSQLLMVAAFAGYEETMHAYEVAIEEGYRFGDYGDAMLIVD